EVYWLNTWYDGTLEKSAALELLNNGCDVMAQHCDSPAPQIAAEEKGVFAIGYNLSTANVAPGAYLTAPLFHWGEYYTANVQSIIDGTWKSEDFWQGLSAGVVSLDTLTALCAPGTAEKVAAAEAAIKDGSLKIFTGEIYDNEGNLKVAAGQTMTDAELTSFDWFVKGVIGSVPKA
ncbi:MAG: BMP family ABC transporter substrate-binding protein, partial [Oscillospiraceae bacterium]|nr:BMP family ABC transporter substrate-binding protein [Oscillospiraceae bacterium]